MAIVNGNGRPESIEKTVESLVRLGTCIDQETLKTLLETRQESRPILIEKLSDESIWDVEGSTSAWGSVAIMHLLSAMGENEEAAIAVTDSVIIHFNDLGDWPTEDGPDVLSGFGKSGFEPLSRMVLDRDLD